MYSKIFEVYTLLAIHLEVQVRYCMYTAISIKVGPRAKRKSRIGVGFRSSCLDQNVVYSWNHPLIKCNGECDSIADKWFLCTNAQVFKLHINS